MNVSPCNGQSATARAFGQLMTVRCVRRTPDVRSRAQLVKSAALWSGDSGVGAALASLDTRNFGLELQLFLLAAT
jgi:hypothetical protein